MILCLDLPGATCPNGNSPPPGYNELNGDFYSNGTTATQFKHANEDCQTADTQLPIFKTEVQMRAILFLTGKFLCTHNNFTTTI